MESNSYELHRFEIKPVTPRCMIENKYYTPEIEEFYVGFEVEYKDVFKTNQWISEKADVDLIGIAYSDWEHQDDKYKFEDVFRVKYLDQEDIESLGWEDWRDMGMSCFRYNLKDPDNEFQLYYQFKDQFCQIYNWDAQFVFQGTIKNKSELKRLMKQLGIE